MRRLDASTQSYAWGSPDAIPDLLGIEASGGPVAEAWLGAHPSAPSLVCVDSVPVALDAHIADDPNGVLGHDVVGRFGVSLPYLLKVISAARPLSLQVHPSIERAKAGFAAEDLAGVPIAAPARNYRDRNHKPELVYALSTFQALCGFRAPRRAAELFDGLDCLLARDISAILHSAPTVDGIAAAFRRLLDPDLRPSAEDVGGLVDACRARLAGGSPSPRADRIVDVLATHFPGDPGVATSLLLNPVTLHPGESMFVPAGGVHAYLSGLAIEVMASSDNVLRAGLTGKHIDIHELLANVDYIAAPPIRIAPETFHGSTKVFYAPVDDFELSVTTVTDDVAHPLPGRGPRILLCLDGDVHVESSGDGALGLTRGQSAFVPASDGPLRVTGAGTLVQADVP